MEIRWTGEQAEAITAGGDTLLSASAGTGKTTTIVGKILWRVGLPVGRSRETGRPVPACEDPCGLDRIAAITFTEKAAHDLERKLREAIEEHDEDGRLRWELDRATVGTIHSFCAELLREHALRLDIDPTFRILDERETQLHQREVVGEVLGAALGEDDPGATELVKRYGVRGWRLAPGAVDRVREVMRDLRWRPRRYEEWTEPARVAGVELGASGGTAGGATADGATRRLDREAVRARARALGAWEEGEDEERDLAALRISEALYDLARRSVGAWLAWLEHENARDFDSLILDARRLLSRAGTRSALQAIRARYRLLLIDEFQDTDRAQWEIARAIAGLDGPGAPPREHHEDRPSEDPSREDPSREDPSREDPSVEDPSPEPPQLFVVGDPKQSIYRFRGADIGVWNEARAAICGDRPPLELSWNFRCEPRLVAFVNRIGRRALDERAAALSEEGRERVVEYQRLRGARSPSPAAGLEWLAIDGPTRAAERREEEAARVAARIRELIGHAPVVDPDSGEMRTCRARDIAVLGRRNDDLAGLEPALRAQGVRVYDAATGGLAGRREVLDLVTALRLAENPFDDLRAFAYLRSPFVGLRDEVLARIALDRRTGAGPLLERAGRYLRAVERSELDWFDPPEGTRVSEVERPALRSGLEAIREAQAVADRVDHGELLQSVLERTGYRLHLLFREDAAEALANVERFLALLEEYRHLPLRRFLALWDRWGDEDLGVPRARLFSSGDDVVTLSTIHAAKGLEWPVVVLVGTERRLVNTRFLSGAYWSDPDLGPVFMPNRADRGARTRRAFERRLLEEKAEEARLLYVALTRARDRLVVTGPTEKPGESFAAWLADELPDAKERHEVAIGEPDPDGNGAGRRRREPRAEAEDRGTGTGSQLDAFGDPSTERSQLDLFAARTGSGEDGNGSRVPDRWPPLVLHRDAASIQTSLAPVPVSLDWLDRVEPGPWPAGVGTIPLPPRRAIASATERMLRERDPERWSLRYEHGVTAEREFLAVPGGDEPLPPALRGTLIHGVLERIEEARELARVLNETIAALELAELEEALAPGAEYREALEAEIERVVESPDWKWYVEGDPEKELAFLHRSAVGGWVQGAFDLYRPSRSETRAGEPSGGPGGQPSLFAGLGAEPGSEAAHDAAGAITWVIDFKTHRIEAEEAARIAGEYAIQARLYRAAAEDLGPRAPVRVAFHFTHPNVAREAATEEPQEEREA